MVKTCLKYASRLAAALLVAGAVSAQSTGADVIVGDLLTPNSYGVVSGIAAYAVGTTSCNIGTVPLNWVAGTNQHPVIGQGVFRLKNDRFEQVGMSWLKHGFTALAQSLCASCQNPGTGALLGVNCSDPYTASLNGSQSGLGSRSEVNAYTGFFTYPIVLNPTNVNLTTRRLQIHTFDVDPAQNAGARYFAEGQYVTPDDAAAGNQMNNASYRECSFSNNANFSMSYVGSTVRMKAAIEAWKSIDPEVSISYIDVPQDGRFIMAAKRVAIGGGVFRWEIAVHNLNCDRSAQSLTVNFPNASAVNFGFHDVDYHSTDPYVGTDWTLPTGPSATPTWSSQTFAQNANANALRWGTTYNFWCESPDTPSGVTIGLFKAGPVGAPTTVNGSFNFPAFNITFPRGRFTTASPGVGADVQVATSNFAGSPDLAGAQLFYRTNGGAFASVSMVNTSGQNFVGTLPAGVANDKIDYYVSIAPNGGGTPVVSPGNAPTGFYQLNVGVDAVVFSDNFQTDLGWTVSTTATDGPWGRGVPVGAGVRGDPPTDGDASGACYLTDNVAGNSDVDNGSTVLNSPIIDVSALSAPKVQVMVWHTNNFGGTNSNPAVDDLKIEMSANGGSSWTLVESISTSVYAWQAKEYVITNFVALTNQFRMRFTSSDLGTQQNVVESGVDGFKVLDVVSGAALLEPYATGQLGAGAGGPYKVLTVNGSDGGAAHRVDVPVNSAITFAMAQPASNAFPAVFAIYGTAGIPGVSDITDAGFGIGKSVLIPYDLNPASPFLFVLTDNMGLLSHPTFIGSTPTPWSDNTSIAPFVPFQVTIQALVYDPTNTTAFLPFSWTNAVLLNVL